MIRNTLEGIQISYQVVERILEEAKAKQIK